jgi:serine protease Do
MLTCQICAKTLVDLIKNLPYFFLGAQLHTSSRPAPSSSQPMKKQLGVLALILATVVPVSISLVSVPAAFALDPDESTTIAVYDSASKAVVSIRTQGAVGAGAIVDSQGLIMTNSHVVQSSRLVQVSTATGNTYSGRVLAVDRRNDLALVQIQAQEKLPTIRLAQMSAKVGQRVYAIGNPFGLDRTLTVGTLSRIASNGDLQTDAALNPGNSGGPLLNSEGDLLGINKAILSPSGGSSGIGFATAIAPVQRLLAGVLNGSGNNDSVAANTPNTPVAPPLSQPSQPKRRPALGLTLEAQSLTILDVQPGSVAERSGLRSGDRLLRVNNYPLNGPEFLQQALEQQQPLVFTVIRNQRIGLIRVRM